MADVNGAWMVIDAAEEQPACIGSVPEVGVRQDEAEDIANILNAMTDGDHG